MMSLRYKAKNINYLSIWKQMYKLLMQFYEGIYNY